MSKAFTAFLLLALLLPMSLAAPSRSAAQEGDAAYFASFDGLERVVARSWMAPLVITESSETVMLNDQGTPVGTPILSTPSATPEPQSGTVLLAIFVYLFDSDENAATGFEHIDEDLQETTLRDPRAPMMDDLGLEGLGDQATGYTGDLTTDNVTLTYTFATVQDGPFVYSVTGTFGGVDAEGLTRGFIDALAGAPMDRVAEQYDPNGLSQGGLWSKLNAVQPEMPEGSTVTDLEIWPVPEGQLEDDSAPDSMDDIALLDSVESIQGMWYLPPESDGTPQARGSGPSRIDAWIVETDSVGEASLLVYAIADVLGAPILVTSSENGIEGSGEDTEILIAQEGFVTDDALPEGNAALVVKQVGTTVYAAIVYTPDETARRVADNIVNAMIDAPADGDVMNRFPQEGDGVLRGLVPAGPLGWAPFATPE